MEIRIDLANIKNVKIVAKPMAVDQVEIKGGFESDPLEQRMRQLYYLSEDCRQVVNSISAAQITARRVGQGSTLIFEVSDV